MPMYFNPAIPFTDLIRLTVIFMLWYYVKKIEYIQCKIGPSWKPIYIKFYAIISIIFIIISLFYGPTFEMTAFQTSLNSVFTAILIWAVFSYVREIESVFRTCQNPGMDFHLVHEFLKLYSLVMVLLIIVFCLFIISIYMTFIPVPKYIATQKIINNTMHTLYKEKKGRKH